MKLLPLYIIPLLLITACQHHPEYPSLQDTLPRDHYYPTEIFQPSNAKIYGTWKFLYKQGGFGGWIIDPTYDYLEIIPFGIYGIVDHDAIQVTGKIQIDQQDSSTTLLQFIPDQIAPELYQIPPKSVWLQGPDTLMLSDLCADCYTDVFKRIH